MTQLLRLKGSKVSTLESDHNSLEQYGHRNNIEITGTPDNVPDQNLGERLWIF